MTDTNEIELIENESTTVAVNSHLTQVSSSERIMSACAGSLFTSLLMTPLDLVKTRLQSQNMPGAKYKLKGTVDGLIKIARYEGPTALFRGLSASLLMAVPSTVIAYAGYDTIREHMHNSRLGTTMLQDYEPLIAGGAARVVAAAVISPMELIRTRMQSAEGMQGFSAVWSNLSSMVRRDGITTLWRGLVPTMLRDVPFSAIYWMGYEETKSLLTSYGYLGHFQVAFLSGASSGMFAAIVTTPFDVIKTQRQVSSGNTGFFRLAGEIVRKEGFQGLFRGIVPRVMRVAPACAIMISSYEVGKRLFANRRLSKAEL